MSRPVRFVPPSTTTQLLGRPQDAPIGIFKALDRARAVPEEKKKLEQLYEMRKQLKELLVPLRLRKSDLFILERLTKDDFPANFPDEAKTAFLQIGVELSDRVELSEVLQLVGQMAELQKSIRVPVKSIDTQIDKAQVKKGAKDVDNAFFVSNIHALRRLRKELTDELVNIDNEDLANLLVQFSDNQLDVEASSPKVQRIYNEIMSFQNLPEAIRTLIVRIFIIQQLIEASMDTGTKKKLFVNPSSESEAGGSVAPSPPKFVPQTPAEKPTKSVLGTSAKQSSPTKVVEPPVVVVSPPSPQKQQPTTTVLPPPATAPAVIKKEEISDSEWAVRSMASAINSLLQRALVPLLDALGGVAFALGRDDIRTLMVYQQPEKLRPCARDLPMERLRIIDELDPELKTVSYLIQRYEPILGGTFLRTYLQQAMESLDRKGEQIVKEEETKTIEINACFDFDRDLKYPVPNLPNSRSLANLKAIQQPSPRVREKIAELEAAQEASQALRLTDAEARFAPAWAFSVLNNSVFRAVASPGMLAAFEMAHNQVRTFPGCSSFTLKELLCSKETMNQFVFLAARHYMRDISVLASQGGPQGGGNRRKGGNYINVNQARKELQERAFLISIWFERVYAVPNPLLNEFDKYRQKLRDDMIVQIAPNLYASYPLAQEFEARMTLYRDALPQRELRHRD